MTLQVEYTVTGTNIPVTLATVQCGCAVQCGAVVRLLGIIVGGSKLTSDTLFVLLEVKSWGHGI